MDKEVSIFWFRRDLRLEDNAGLYYALKENARILPLFIFDTDILNPLDRNDARVSFIYEEVILLHKQLLNLKSSILIKVGKPLEVFSLLIKEYNIKSVYTNTDYEPYATARDLSIKDLLSRNNIFFKEYKDQVIFEKDEVVSGTGTPYKVFTPYKSKWLATLNDFYLKPYPTSGYFENFLKIPPIAPPTLAETGFELSSIVVPPREVVEEQLRIYSATRNYPKENSTSRLGIHLRFGTISIRHLAGIAKKVSEVWLSELVWREFFMQLLFNFPRVVNEPFNNKFKNLAWRHNEHDFERWCEGRTGYTFVDAGMRELNATGYMHNRARLVTASFLTKHLLIDWKWGEAYFGKKLLDYDLASNNGNWQWSAGTGADAQPFFRIFNPILQQKKFDPDFEYVKKWVTDFGTSSYPSPMIEHEQAILRAKKAFGLIQQQGSE